MVLERDQRQGLLPAAAEPELQGHEQDLAGGGEADQRVGVLLLTNEGAKLETGGSGDRLPDLEPVSVMGVKVVTSDLDGDGFDERMTHGVGVVHTDGRGLGLLLVVPHGARIGARAWVRSWLDAVVGLVEAGDRRDQWRQKEDYVGVGQRKDRERAGAIGDRRTDIGLGKQITIAVDRGLESLAIVCDAQSVSDLQ